MLSFDTFDKLLRTSKIALKVTIIKGNLVYILPPTRLLLIFPRTLFSP